MKTTRLTLLAAVLICVLSRGPRVEASTWTIPGVANAFGANSTHFVSDLAITNPGNASVVATVTFLSTGLPVAQGRHAAELDAGMKSITQCGSRSLSLRVGRVLT